MKLLGFAHLSVASSKKEYSTNRFRELPKNVEFIVVNCNRKYEF